MFKKKEEIETKDTYWWLGPVGVIFVIILIAFGMLRSIGPIRLDDLASRTKTRIKRRLKGKLSAIWLGMQIEPITKDSAVEFGIGPRQRGVVVVDIAEGVGANAATNVGDVIVAINGAKITDFESFLWLAKQSKFSDGILLDVITNGKRRYVSMPFLFQGGPLLGPNANHWQLGSPLSTPAFGYGKLVAFPNNANPAPQGYGRGPCFMICPNCGHSAVATPAGPFACPNCRMQMLRNQ